MLEERLRTAGLTSELTQVGSGYTSDPTTSDPDPAFVNSNINGLATDPASEPGPIDELTDVFGSFTIGDAGELRFYGASSNLNLNRNQDFNVASSIGTRLQGINAAGQLPGLWDLSEEVRDHLLGLYWQWQNSWQYVVPRESFLHDLHVDKSGRFCTPLLLAAILAHSSRYTDRIEVRSDPLDPNTAGKNFYVQAKTMLHHEMEAPTTSTVQAACLLALYGAALDSEALGWVYAGMASRMAFSLGLHSNCTEYIPKGVLSNDDAEARNVAWWGSYVIDRLFGIGYGRPAGIQEYNITAAMPSTLLDNQPLMFSHETEDSGHLSFPIEHIATNAIYTCKLFQITSEVLDQLYARQSEWTEMERDDFIMRVHLRLVAFYDGLPKVLKIPASSREVVMPHVYQLHLQYHVQMILIHRPFFRGLGERRDDKQQDVAADIHTQSCRISADKISSIFRSYRSTYGLRNIPISAVHPAFTAAVIHLGDLKSVANPSQSKIMPKLQILVKSLYDMNIAWSWSNRSIRGLEALAKEWKINIWSGGMRDEISTASLLSFQRYMTGEVYNSRDQIAVPPESANQGAVPEGMPSNDWCTFSGIDLGYDIFGAAMIGEHSLFDPSI
ncbi:nitrogen assimilation transcription factor nit-4 [Phlyctema vagabunda]|uniref:Nitrogen assimilation transcription factor nit-4 n=1 Tax=Phlyctema vagabunda TaxID=108571 RepID=A0ABR4P8G6_9HELO